jgi:indolepyruvate ferredoxin oxidoreductase alpha subunit
MDNRITAMTGHQPNPGMGKTALGEDTVAIDIETMLKAMGIKHVKTIDPYNVKLMTETIKDFLNKDTLTAIVAKRICKLLEIKEKKKKGIKIPKFQIEKGKENIVKKNIAQYSCPAIIIENGKCRIDRNMCTGCAVCSVVFPQGTMKVVIE